MSAEVSIRQSGRGDDDHGFKDETILTHAGRYPRHQHGAVNPPIVRASTIVFAFSKSTPFTIARASNGLSFVTASSARWMKTRAAGFVTSGCGMPRSIQFTSRAKVQAGS